MRESSVQTGKIIFDLLEQGFEPQIFSIFPAHDLNFHEGEGDKIKSKQASKRDTAILVCCIFAHLHPKYHMHLDQRIFLIFVAVLFRFYVEFLKCKDQLSCIGFFSTLLFYQIEP